MANKKAYSSQDIVKKIDLLYMSPSQVSAKEIAVLLQNENGLTIELWEDMNVLELVLPNHNSIDFEPLDVDFKDPSDASFVKNRNIITIFAVNLCEQDLSIATACFEKIVDKFSGFLCADSEDFNPVYVGTSKK